MIGTFGFEVVGNAQENQMRSIDIFVIEDDPAIRQTIRNAWPNPGDNIRFASTYNQCLGIIFSPELALFDAVIVDVQLPDGDGLSILRTIRANSAVPIIMISGSGSPDARASMFEVGADDYVMKPFSVRELHARVSRRVAVVRLQQPAPEVLTFKIGVIDCDLQMKRLCHAQKTETLTDAEARILGYLHANAGRNCSKSAIYKHAFFRDFSPGDKTLDVYIGRIRKKAGDLHPGSVSYLQTARGAGYKLELDRAQTTA
jgi:DNA-binding response OmpR family regulator